MATTRTHARIERAHRRMQFSYPPVKRNFSDWPAFFVFCGFAQIRMAACVARVRGRWYKVCAAIRETTSPGDRGEAMRALASGSGSESHCADITRCGHQNPLGRNK
jgi:hypothetical protein